jgi:endogenous inhibitor of DNA gyrase (YacG/DUF329 family)
MAKMIYLKDWQKERIKELQLQGYKYEDIGLAVGLPPESTRSYCKRNDLPKGIPSSPLPPVTIYCATCGKEVEQNPHRKLKRYCCTQCRWDYANSHRDSTNRKFHTCTCAYCGKTFQSVEYRPRKYCSKECMLNARRKLETD